MCCIGGNYKEIFDGIVRLFVIISMTGRSFLFVCCLERDRDVLTFLSHGCWLRDEYTVTHYKFYTTMP